MILSRASSRRTTTSLETLLIHSPLLFCPTRNGTGASYLFTMIDNADNDNLPQSILSRGGCLSYALVAREEILADGLPRRRW